MNGSGLHAGGGSGGGYVPSQGWEFVPCSRMEKPDKSKGKNRNPLRRISSPPTVFSQIYEQQFQASGEHGPAPSELIRGQMWSSPESPQQQQSQHARLKKKFEELKKRHVEDKEEWTREKESLLREVANIQGGENRRILLDLKTVLEEVQVEVKREEEKRSELQLQYTRDRCSWELEKAELKRRIAQLESREGGRLVNGGIQSAAGLGAGGVARSPQKYPEDVLRREREEQRRLLAESHTTAMDLRCRLEHSERDWLREKAELLERFDVERREWECQLKDMQRKIEELYCEVRAKREGTGMDIRKHYEDSTAHRLSTGSSLLSDNSRSEPLSSSSQSEQRSALYTGFGSNNKLNQDSESLHSAAFNFDTHDHVQTAYEEELMSSRNWRQDPASQRRDVIDTEELDGILQLHRCAESIKTAAKENENVLQKPRENPSWTELNYGSEKKRNTTALNAALKEIARVSEELCSYQEEIRLKSGDKRNPSEDRDTSQHHSDSIPDVLEPCDLSQIYDELRALEREHWITLSPDNTWRSISRPRASGKNVPSQSDSFQEPQFSPGAPSEIDSSAPPIPPRSSSWNLSSQQETDLCIPESPLTTARKCHSPCVVVDRKCTSPSIVRKFEAMLQENEGKVLMDGVVSSCAVPANPNCNVNCCHSRWSCDASKLTNKVSSYGTVQKSFSEVNIVTAAKTIGTDYSPVGAILKKQEVQQRPQVMREAPVHLSAPEIPPASPVLQGSRRNLTLEQKTAEFNRCLFQAEMGRGVEEQDTFSPPDLSPVLCQQVLLTSAASGEELLPRETQFKQHSEVPSHCFGVEAKITQSHSISDVTKQTPEPPAQTRYSPRGPPIKMEREIHDPPFKEVHAADACDHAAKTSQSPVSHSEVRLSPSRKTPIKATTEVLYSERSMSENISLTVDSSSSESECEEKPQSRAGLSQSPFAEKKHKVTGGQQVQPKHVSASDSCRPGLRIMNEHPWKQLTLAAYPRPEGSRSNFGAVERILKNYETAAKNQQRGTASSPNLSMREKSDSELDVQDMDSTPLFIRETLPHSPSTHKILELKEIQLNVQANQESSTASSAKKKNFSRPARPANRRLPSRWAGRSPFSRSPPSSSTVAPSSFSLQKHSSFSYSRAFHMETVIL